MPRRKRLVIDASVARAAGSRPDAGGSSRPCRLFLEAVLTICHRAVVTAEISREWRSHRSGFFRKWLVQMYARKKVDRVEAGGDSALRRQLEACGAGPREISAMAKDLHLVEAALGSDRIVVSRDDTVRRLFSAYAASLAGLRQIVWVNPDLPEEEALTWLEGGAKSERGRRLGAG